MLPFFDGDVFQKQLGMGKCSGKYLIMMDLNGILIPTGIHIHHDH